MKGCTRAIQAHPQACVRRKKRGGQGPDVKIRARKIDYFLGKEREKPDNKEKGRGV